MSSMIFNTFTIRETFVKKVLLLFFTLSFTTISFGQKIAGIVKGTIVDSASKEPIGKATISLIKEKDSLFKTVTLTSNNGNFEIKNLQTGNYILLATYQDLETLKKSFSISDQSNLVDFDTLKMEKAYKTLHEVVVKDVAPIKVKGDTIAYKADAFKTKPNATVEDLLKKLPGVQVDRGGTVKAQGEQVQKVYVDGKEFFSNDPKLATNNLTADMIDQVQVFNDMSEQSKFNGIEDGSRAKAINLKLKKDKKKGLLGKAYVGAGTDERFNAGISANYIKGASQISLIARANNINNTGYTLTDMTGVLNNKNRGGAGITKTSYVGLNYRDTWSKSFDVNGSYFFNHANMNNIRQSFKQTFLSDSTLLTNRETIYNTISENHRFNLNIIYTIDSLNSIIYSPNVTIQNSEVFNSDTLTDYINKAGANYKADDSRVVNSNNGQGYNWTNNLIWRRRFNRTGRTLSVNFSNALNKIEQSGYNIIHSRFYKNDELLYLQRNTDYKISNNNQTDNYAFAVSYTEPLSTNKILEFNYHLSNNKNASDRRTYNYDSLTKTYNDLVDTLTNKFKNVNTYNSIGTNFRGTNKNYNYQFGLSVQQVLMQSKDLSKNIYLKHNYINLLPAASFNYRFANNKSFQISYRGQSNQPSVTQLQNITDITTYPYIRKGNPNLKQEFVNSVVATYNSFNLSTLHNLFAYVTFTSTLNKISNSIQQNGGEQITTPVNLNGVYNVSGNLNFGLPIKRMEGGNFNTTTHLDYFHNVSLINNFVNYGSVLSFGEDISLNYNYKEKLDLGINANVTYNTVNYTIQKEQSNSYFTHDYSIDATYSLPKGFILSTTADYTLITGEYGGFNQNYILWNASLSKQLFKNKRGQLTFSINDILNQNRSVSRTVADNFIEDTRNTALKRFAMLTFTYNLNQMRGKSNQMLNKLNKAIMH